MSLDRNTSKEYSIGKYENINKILQHFIFIFLFIFCKPMLYQESVVVIVRKIVE